MTTTKQVYYKVVETKKDKLVSSFANDNCSIYRRQYQLNRVTVAPKGTYLWIFDTLENAKNYRSFLAAHYMPILECHAKNVRKPYTVITTAIPLFDNYWQVVREARTAKKNIMRALTDNDFYVKPITGTLWCKELTPIKYVQ